jgi:hypothetical protein
MLLADEPNIREVIAFQRTVGARYDGRRPSRPRKNSERAAHRVEMPKDKFACQISNQRINKNGLAALWSIQVVFYRAHSG